MALALVLRDVMGDEDVPAGNGDEPFLKWRKRTRLFQQVVVGLDTMLERWDTATQVNRRKLEMVTESVDDVIKLTENAVGEISKNFTVQIIEDGLMDPPLADFYFGQVIGLPPDLRAFTDPAIVLMVPYPFLMACEVMLRGFLIKQQRTGATRLAMACYLLMLGAALIGGIAFQIGTGAQIAATAILLAISSEVTLLALQAAPVAREMRRAA